MALNFNWVKTPILKGLSRKRKKRGILKSSFEPRKKKPNFGKKKKKGFFLDMEKRCKFGKKSRRRK
jgi:hypothetical protein